MSYTGTGERSSHAVLPAWANINKQQRKLRRLCFLRLQTKTNCNTMIMHTYFWVTEKPNSQRNQTMYRPKNNPRVPEGSRSQPNYAPQVLDYEMQYIASGLSESMERQKDSPCGHKIPIGGRTEHEDNEIRGPWGAGGTEALRCTMQSSSHPGSLQSSRVYLSP